VGSPSALAPVNDRWSGAGGDTRIWRGVDGNTAPTATQSAYTIELLSANPAVPCSTSDPSGTMIDAKGAFKIRVTGRGATNGPRRSIVATFRRRSFLDYLWFTDFETNDPPLAAMSRGYTSSTPDFNTWAAQNCAQHFYEGRDVPTYSGTVTPGGNVSGVHCGTISFVTGDTINGPIHSNDSLHVCGTPSFGRVDGSGNPVGDRIELSAPAADDPATPIDESPWRGCNGSNPNFHNGLQTAQPQMNAPPDNRALGAAATYSFRGKTYITLSGSTMSVRDQNGGPTNYTIYPGTVVYVRNGPGCPTPLYNPIDPYGDAADCADAFVHGTYAQDMTIGSAKDVVIDGDITRTAGKLLGLIADQYVRLYHPITNPPASFDNGGNCTDANGPGSLDGVTITAAILAVQHSFVVDNYRCGADFNNKLTVVGAIAQKFRGAVGVTGSHGYLKNYSYDENLRYRSPPKFLDPVQSAWQLTTMGEQKPAT
jgi:hypothetical protein